MVYKATYFLGIVGYLILLLIFTGLGLLLPLSPDTIMETGVTLVFYGVYYGVMGRDCAELCVDYMAASMTVSWLFVAAPYQKLAEYQWPNSLTTEKEGENQGGE